MRRLSAAGLFVGVLVALAAGSAAAREKTMPPAAPPLVVDINRAGVEDFERLRGIGPEIAHRIVAYRTKHGPFRRVEDLMAVDGMGPRKWRALRPYLRVGKEGEKKASQ
jgi:competence protein ComEA